MNTETKLLLTALALCASAWIAAAQDDNAPPANRERPPRRERAGGPNQQGGPGQRPMVPPLVAALDANHDGVIDEQEIENASKALKTLDKNGDGKLTMDELHPPRPEGANGPGFGRGPGGQRGPRGAGFGRGLGGPPPGDGQAPPPGPAPEQ